MSRYPYTEAYDALREAATDLYARETNPPSRAETAKIVAYIADVIGFTKEDLASRIADYARSQKA